MCGICGYFGQFGSPAYQQNVLRRMTRVLLHRGPDDEGEFTNHKVGLGFRRLSLVDLAGGNQPLSSEDGSLVSICNGEIYNYRELREDLVQRGHCFRTQNDTEVLPHLYEEYGVELLGKLNGQFAFALYDQSQQTLFLARDQFGICPLYYTIASDTFIFASEIKAILEHPLTERNVDLTGLDQVFSLPGLVSPRTMFKNISSLESGHYLVVKNNSIRNEEYWDLDYPREGEISYGTNENQYLEELECELIDAVRLRLHADVPVGLYLSGGLDSSLIAGLANLVQSGEKMHSFAVEFEDKEFSEAEYQNLVARHVGSEHHTIHFGWQEIGQRLETVIRHCECPIKETYNTASLALSECARNAGIRAVLAGEGADELFAGYVGYRFDQFRRSTPGKGVRVDPYEEEIRARLWGDPTLFYELDYGAFSKVKQNLYSDEVNKAFPSFNCLNFELVDKTKIRGRQFVHQRSYLDFKLRMGDHLLTDHGDKMASANSVEGRYPFLDPRVVSIASLMPPHLKLNGYTEKYALRKVAEKLLPAVVASREKFAFVAPGSPYLLQGRIDWLEDILSTERIRSEGYFNPRTIEAVKQRYATPGFSLNSPYENDLLIVVLTFGLFLRAFNLPSFLS